MKTSQNSPCKKFHFSDNNLAELGLSILTTATVAFLVSVGELLVTGDVHWKTIVAMSVGKALIKVGTEYTRSDR